MLDIGEDSVRIAASAPAGALYGATTLELLARQGEGLPCGRIADRPEWRHRGAQISYAQMNVGYRDEYLRHFIRAMAELKLNTVYLYLEWRYQFPSIPELQRPDYLSPAQARAIQRYAAQYNVTVVPALNVLGHTSDLLALQAFHGLGEYDAQTQDARVDDSAALCTSNPRTRALISGALSDIMDAFDCEIIHVGGDEVEALGVCERCRAEYPGKSKAEIYIDYFCWVRDQLKARGRLMGLWSDMLLGFFSGDAATRDYAGKLLDGTVVFDWQYDSAHTEAIDLLAGTDLVLSTSVHGCSVGAPCLNQSDNQRDYFADGFKYSVRGGLATDWIYGHGYHGAQMGPLFATASALMWQGAQGEFARGSSRDGTCLAYARQTYGVGRPLLDYWHMAGDAAGELLRHYEGGLSGSYLRRSAYLDDSPLGSFIHYARALRGDALSELRAAVERLGEVWAQVEANARPTPDLPFMRGPLVLHRYLLAKFSWAQELFAAYDAAAAAQFSAPDEFAARLKAAARCLREYDGAFDEPLRYLRECSEVLGLETGSALRVSNTHANLRLLADFMESLADGRRPLPTLKNANDFLFARPLTNFWAPRNDEWYAEREPFVRTDGDNGREWGAAR